jgi:hypothetical protein
MDTQERFLYSEAGRRAPAKFERKRREEEERAKPSAKHRAEKTHRVKLSNS